MRKRTFRRWVSRLAGVAIATVAAAVAAGAFMATNSDVSWGLGLLH